METFTTPISDLAELVNIGTLLAFILVSAGVLILRRTQPNIKRSFRTPGVPMVPILAMLVCLGLMLYLPLITGIRFVIWLVLGIAVYFLYGVRHSRLARVTGTEVISEKEIVGSD